MTGAHPRHRLDPLIHAPIRLSIMAYLSEIGRAEFALVRDAVELTAAALSKQVSALEEAGYVTVERAMSANGRETGSHSHQPAGRGIGARPRLRWLGRLRWPKAR